MRRLRLRNYIAITIITTVILIIGLIIYDRFIDIDYDDVGYQTDWARIRSLLNLTGVESCWWKSYTITGYFAPNETYYAGYIRLTQAEIDSLVSKYSWEELPRWDYRVQRMIPPPRDLKLHKSIWHMSNDAAIELTNTRSIVVLLNYDSGVIFFEMVY